MRVLQLLNILMGALFLCCYAYQGFYLLYTLFRKPKTYPPTDQSRRYAVLICARNEEAVIGRLLDSIREQDYPRDRLSVFVCADNCDDGTAAAARAGGAEVLERRDTERVGKGYALHDLIRHVFSAYGEDAYDGYLIVDADNLLSPDYLTEMDRCFSPEQGRRIVTGYRNAKNFPDNWLSSAYGVWFLHEARQLNNARSLLGVSCAVSGTGFLVHKDILKENGGWNWTLLIEDVEFSADMILKGERIAYCHNAVLYDEQPTSFRQSWNQRLRWCRGYLQVVRRYGWRLVGRILRGSFSAFDMLMNIAPAYLLTVLLAGLNVSYVVTSFVTDPKEVPWALLSAAALCVGGYLLLFCFSLCAAATERRRIAAPTRAVVRAVFAFPIFMLTFIPIAVTALFTPRVGWKPVVHQASVSVEEVRNLGAVKERDGARPRRTRKGRG